MKKIFYILLLLLFTSSSNQAQVFFTGWDGVSGDKFSFVLGRDYAAGEVVYFTEDDYIVSSSNFGTGSEAHISWEAPAGGLLKDDVIQVVETSTNTFTVSAGTATHISGSGSWSFGTADELYAYQSSNPASPWNNITTIYCFAYFHNVALNLQPNQDPSSDHPTCLILDFGDSPGAGVYDFMVAPRLNTTRNILATGTNWNHGPSTITFDLTDFTNSALPVDLIRFEAEEINQTVAINWSTASELNNEYFEVQHSIDGSDYKNIAVVEGKGTTDLLTNYHFVHKNPVNGINYYRLKQVDFDGRFDHTDAVAININVNSSTAISPNPFSDLIQFEVEKTYNRDTQFEVYDMTGRIVHTGLLEKDQLSKTINLSNLQSGVFILRIGNGENAISQRIVKL